MKIKKTFLLIISFIILQTIFFISPSIPETQYTSSADIKLLYIKFSGVSKSCKLKFKNKIRNLLSKKRIPREELEKIIDGLNDCAEDTIKKKYIKLIKKEINKTK